MKETIRWDMVNPEGVVVAEQASVNPHPETLESKTVLLRWNGKHNGDVFLNRIAELLVESVTGIRIMKSWEILPATATNSGNPATSQESARKLADLKPDIVIASQGD